MPEVCAPPYPLLLVLYSLLLNYFTPSADRVKRSGNLSSRTKAFLFMCFTGLHYTEKECPVNWFAGVGHTLLKRAWADVGLGLLGALSNFFESCVVCCVSPNARFTPSSNFFILLANQAANTFHVWTCDLSPHPFHQITVFL